MKLALYGGGDEGDSLELDKITIELTGKKKPSMTYIPSSHYWAEDNFRTFVKHYSKLGLERFVLFPVDIPFTQSQLKLALDSDVIHLSGGNTYYFLRYIRKEWHVDKIEAVRPQGRGVDGNVCGSDIDDSQY